MINFETVYAALWTKLSTLSGFNTLSRRLKHWDEVDPKEQPALFQSQGSINITQTQRIPAKYVLSADLYVYAHSTDKAVAPATVLNPLVTAVNTLLAPDITTGVQTLGLANVSHCWIEGEIATDEGVLGDQAVAIIPVKILATD